MARDRSMPQLCPTSGVHASACRSTSTAWPAMATCRRRSGPTRMHAFHLRRSRAWHQVDLMRTDQRDRRPGRTVRRQRNVRQSRNPRPPIRDVALDPDRFTQELVHERRRRFGIQPIRRIHLLDPSGAHHRDAVRHFHRLGLIVRDEDAGEPHPVMQIAQPDAQALSHLGIQRAERFVQQQQLGLDRQRARQRNALPLSAGYLLGIAVREVADAQQIQQRLHARTDLARRRPLRACAHLQAKPDIALPPSCDGTARSAGTRSRRDARAPARRAWSGRR